MSQQSLDDILNEDTPAMADIRAKMPEPAEPETGVTPAEPEAAPEAPAEPPSALPKEVYEPLRAVRDENKALKEQLEALRREVTAKPKEPEAPPPSIWEDEQGAFQHFGGQVVSQAVQQATLNARLDMSEMMARQTHPDFEEMKAEFVRMMQENPALQQQALSDPHPWQKAYQIAKSARTMQELGATNIDELTAKIRAQVEAEMAASRPPAIPPSLSTQRSVSSRNGPAWSGPPTMKDLLA